MVSPVPTFCRHSRLIQNCPICAREQDLELRPVVSPSGPRPRSTSAPSAPRPARTGQAARTRAPARAGVTVRRLTRGADDGYRSDLAPGLRSSADAGRLAGELAWAQARLVQLAESPPGLYAEVADPAADIEERTWLAFQIAYLGPLDGPAPLAAIERARCSWASGQAPALTEADTGPRGVHESGLALRTPTAYRAWAGRAGSQAAAFSGEPSWTPERRFARVFERLSLPGFHRGARFELLTTLGQTGTYEMTPGALSLGGSDPVALGAKRLLGIGDPMLLERRAAELAQAAGLPLAALDVGFFNWERGSRASLGMAPELEADPGVLADVQSALGL
jgi:hypothetical protein